MENFAMFTPDQATLGDSEYGGMSSNSTKVM
jgi:hypothetical protein